MQLNSQNYSNRITQSQPNFGLIDLNPRKFAKKFYPKGGEEAERFFKKAEAAKNILKRRTKDVHAIVIPAEDYDGTRRIDICIQELTPEYKKSWNPLVNLVRWGARKLEIKYKEPREVGYTYFGGIDDFTTNVTGKIDELKGRFYGTNTPQIQPKEVFVN